MHMPIPQKQKHKDFDGDRPPNCVFSEAHFKLGRNGRCAYAHINAKESKKDTICFLGKFVSF